MKPSALYIDGDLFAVCGTCHTSNVVTHTEVVCVGCSRIIDAAALCEEANVSNTKEGAL